MIHDQDHQHRGIVAAGGFGRALRTYLLALIKPREERSSRGFHFLPARAANLRAEVCRSNMNSSSVD